MNDVIGYIRVILPRYAMRGQQEAMERNEVQHFIVESTKKHQAGIPGTRAEVTRMMCKGRTLAIQHLFLLADPKAKRGQSRRDLWKAMDEIEKRGGVIWELYTGLKTSDRKERDQMMRDAVEALAKGRHKRSASDKRGRPVKEFSADEMKTAQAAWHNRKLKTWAQVKEALPAGFSLARAHKLWGARE